MDLTDDVTRLRDEVESVLRAWDAHETGRGATGIVDYDCHPTGEPVEPAPDRLWVLTRLTGLHRRAEEIGAAAAAVADRVRADLAFLRARLGERAPLDAYLRATQGCPATAWSDDELAARRELAVDALAAIGVSWDDRVETALREIEEPVPVDEAGDAIQAAAGELEPAVRALTGTEAPYTLTVEQTDVDAYWGYWLDGSGPAARLRLNRRRVRFTRVRARQFALHEVLGHALQSASYAHRAAREPVPWVRLLSVHTPYQVLLEGLAQALPLFVTPDDPVLTARVRLAHYVQLVLARLHVTLDQGVPAELCAADARALAPFLGADQIADALADRGADPLLRSYLWSYPAGIDWFVRLADTAAPEVVGAVLRAAYRDPLTPADLDQVVRGAGTVPPPQM